MALPTSRVDREFQSYRQDLRGQTARRIVNVNDYYSTLALYIDKLYASGFATLTTRFYDLTEGHFYEILLSGVSNRVISVKQTAEGWIINPSDSLPTGDGFIVQENADLLLQENGSGILY
jgi:hypothetical protein